MANIERDDLPLADGQADLIIANQVLEHTKEIFWIFHEVSRLSLIHISAGPQAVVVDLQGNVIWYCPGNAEPVKPLQNGHFIIVRPLDLQEVDLACNVIRDVSYTKVNQSLQANGYDFTIPPPLGLNGGNPFHHDVLVLPNGHWIGLCEIAKNFTDLPGYPGTKQVVGDALVLSLIHI